MIKGSTRIKNIVNICIYCSKSFNCCDPKTKRCDDCKKCLGCGKELERVIANRCCRICQKKYFRTEKQKQQLINLHNAMKGNNNPAKRPEIRLKLSESKKGKLNPSFKYPEKWAENIAKYRPKDKTSKLETIVAQVLPEFTRQYEVGWYKLDFADVVKKVAVEVQGCWWHCCKKCFPESPTHKAQKINIANDLRKKKYLINRGWVLIYISEHEIMNNHINEIRGKYVSKY